MANQNKAGFMSAVAEGAKGLTQGVETRPQAQLAKKRAEQDIKQIDYENETEALKAEVDALRTKANEAAAENTKQATYRALTRYSADFNPKHLNSTIKGEYAKSSGIVGFRALNPAADSALYTKNGFTAEDFQASQEAGMSDDFSPLDEKGSPKPLPIHGRYVVATMQDGSEKLVDVFKFKQAVGWFKELDANQTAAELQRAKLGAGGDDRKGWSEWRKKATDMEEITGKPQAETMGMQYTDAAVGNAGGQLATAEVNKANLDKNFSGSFKTNFDPSNPEHRDIAETDIESIERMQGIKWSASQLSDVQDIAAMISLSDPDKALTDEGTGLYDNTIYNVKKYFSDESDSGANMAYAAFRNGLRNALYGSALTEHEIAAFDEQLGSLKQKRGPLLTAMVNSLGQVQAKLEAIYSMQNSYVSKFRLGVNKEKLAKSIDAIQKNIATIKALDTGKIPPPDPTLTPEEQRSKKLTEIGKRI